MGYRELLRFGNIRWLAAARFLTSMVFYSTVIVAFETGRGLNYTGIFALESVLSLAIFLFEVPTGIWADRFGHRRLVIVGYGLEFLAMVLYAVSVGFWMFAASTFLFGIGLACLSGCETALLYEGLPHDRREEGSAGAFALLNAAGSGGFFCGLAVGSFIGAKDPALAVYATLIPFGLGALAAFRLRDSDFREERAESTRAALLLRQALGLVRKEPSTVALRLLGSAAFAFVNAALWFNQDLFAREGIPVYWFGPITALAMGAQMLAGLATPGAERRLGRSAALALSCLVPGLAYVGAAYLPGGATAAVLVAIVLAGSAWRGPLLDAEINGRIPDGARATTLSTLSFLGTVAGIGLNLLIGAAGDAGLQTALVALGAGLVALAVLPAFLVRRAP